MSIGLRFFTEDWRRDRCGLARIFHHENGGEHTSMKSSDALNKYRIEIRSVVAANRADNPRVFGSVLHGTDEEDSDLDLLIDPTPETTLFDLARIKGTLEALLGVRVDVLTPRALPDHFRSRVQAEAEPV